MSCRFFKIEPLKIYLISSKVSNVSLKSAKSLHPTACIFVHTYFRTQIFCTPWTQFMQYKESIVSNIWRRYVPKLIWICCIRTKPFTAIEQMQRYLSGSCARYSRFKQESDKGRLHPRHYSNPIKCSQRLTECFFCYFSYVFKNQAWKVLHPLLIQQFPDLVDKYEEGAEKRRSVQTASV